MTDPTPGKRLPVASSETGNEDEAVPEPPSLFWTLVVPAVGAVIILSAGFFGQCFGSP